jgi:hypothetical protein
MFLIFSVGIGWKSTQIDVFENLPKFDLRLCQRTLKIMLNNDGSETFPRLQIEASGRDEIEKYFLDIGVLNIDSHPFQLLELLMNFDSVDFNWLCGAQSNINEEYANALETRVEQLYRNSWVGQYFNYDVKSEDGVVFFWSKTKKSIVDTYRIQTLTLIPKNSRPYFLPKSDWSKYSDEDGDVFVETSVLSNVPHGFKTKPFPSAKSLVYKSPFFLVFRAPPSVNSNYLLFTSFDKPNSENCILAMLIYNENEDIFVSQFSPGITLPYLQSLTLNNKLEFKLFDSESKQVQISNLSQIFICLQLL